MEGPAPAPTRRGRSLVLLFAGFALVASGVAAMITAELGVAPYDVLLTGIVARTDLPIGVAAMVLPVLFAGSGFLLGGRVGPGTVLAVLCIGPLLQWVLALLPELDAIEVRIPFLVVGFAMVTCGITSVILADLGPGPAEVLMLAVHDRGVGLAVTRTAIEAVSVAIGWALGGQVGAGTVLVVLLIGPVLRQLLKWSGWEHVHPDRPADAAALCAEPGV